MFWLSITRVFPSRARKDAAEARLCRTCRSAAGGDRDRASFPLQEILNSQPDGLLTFCLSLRAAVSQIQTVEGPVAMCGRFVGDFGELNETRVGRELKL